MYVLAKFDYPHRVLNDNLNKNEDISTVFLKLHKRSTSLQILLRILENSKTGKGLSRDKSEYITLKVSFKELFGTKTIWSNKVSSIQNYLKHI